MSDEPLSAEILAYSVYDAAKIFPLGHRKLYELMQNGVLRYAVVGGKKLIPRAELERLLREGDGSKVGRGLHGRRAVEASSKDEGDAK